MAKRRIDFFYGHTYHPWRFSSGCGHLVAFTPDRQSGKWTPMVGYTSGRDSEMESQECGLQIPPGFLSYLNHIDLDKPV